MMLKPVIAATALFALAGSSYVYAQQGFGGHGDGGPRAERHHRPSPADIAAFTDARIAALKAGLELTPDQVKSWPPFEQAVRDMVQLRIQRMQARQSGDQQTPTSPFDRLSRRADAMAKSGAALKKVADAGAPLYQSLDDAQKGRFMMLARILRPHHHMHAFNDRGDGGRDGQGGGHGWGHGRHFGQNDNGPGGKMQKLSGQDGASDDQGSQL
jgi:zinc resistance-associated protein